jgi:hypothetical protein
MINIGAGLILKDLIIDSLDSIIGKRKKINYKNMKKILVSSK